MSRATFFFRAAQLNILVLCGVLLGGFAFQFVSGELPCPLCMLQRHAMMLCALGPAFLIARARHGEMQYRDVATGYGLAVLAAVAGASVSVRQILLHIVPPDPGYGGTVLGLHVYTWALLVFVAELIAAGLNLTFAGGLEGRRIEWGTDSRLVLGLLGFAILANAAVVFVEAGLHVSLDDNPDRYKLFYDLWDPEKLPDPALSAAPVRDGPRRESRREPRLMKKTCMVRDAALLRRVRYFAFLPAAELSALARRCASRTLAKGEVLFEEGETCRGLYVVAEGKLEIGQVSVRGREQVLHTEGPGATLGEGPLFDRGGFIATAVAIAPTRVLLLPRADLLTLCHRRPGVALVMLETLARRVRTFAGIVTDLAFRPVTERLAHYIVGAVAHPIAPGAFLELGLTHTQLAARLGTVRELVSRAVARLEASGAITRARGQGRIVIRDPAQLETLARGDMSGR